MPDPPCRSVLCLPALTCAFAGLCYAEFASIIPIAGSAYTYGYATLGELVAWIIGWDLTLEYAFGASTVASGWAGYFNSLLQQLGIFFPPAFTTTTGNVLVKYQGVWIDRTSLPPGVIDAGLPHVTGICNLIAVLIVMAITTILVIGIKESANFNSAIVIIKLGIVGIFLVVGGYFLFHHPDVARANWHPFIPPADGHGNFGWGGIPTAAASIFFAYIGFDAVSTAAQEAKNPERDMPIGILGSLVVCTILYILVSLVLTGLVSYKTLNVSAPVALAIDATGVGWGSMLVKVGAVFGLATVMLVMLLGQTRVFYSMSRDGLLPKWASSIHPKFRTPWITTIVFGSFAAIMPAFLPISRLSELVNIGTLLAFTIVCAGVWVLRVRHPEMKRPFKTPLVPLVPILGIGTALFPHVAAGPHHLDCDDCLAAHWVGDLLYLFGQTQQGAETVWSAGRRLIAREQEKMRNGFPDGRPFCFEALNTGIQTAGRACSENFPATRFKIASAAHLPDSAAPSVKGMLI